MVSSGVLSQSEGVPYYNVSDERAYASVLALEPGLKAPAGCAGLAVKHVLAGLGWADEQARRLTENEMLALPSYTEFISAAHPRGSEAVAMAKRSDLAGAQTVIGRLVGELKAAQPRTPNLDAMLADVEGQITEAISREDWYTKWGGHYLPSLARAHQLQQCNNFKDPGIQQYGGELFKQLRDHADDLFCKLPPPKPSVGGGYSYRPRSASGAGAAGGAVGGHGLYSGFLRHCSAYA